jgi:hypothetical protein
MLGTPGLRCPECGREAKSERKLHKGRRRWRFAILSLPIFVAAHIVWSVPLYQSRGWVALVPSTYLAFFGPTEGSSPPPLSMPVSKLAAQGWAQASTTTSLTTFTSFQSAFSPSPGPLSDEVWSRILAGRLYEWQSSIYLGRIMRANAIDPSTFMHIPKAWPIGKPIPFHLLDPDFAELRVEFGPLVRSFSADGSDAFAPPRSPTQSISVEFCLRGTSVAYRRTLRIPIDITRPPETFMHPDSSPEATAKVQAELAPHIAIVRGHPELIFHNRPDTGARAELPFVVAYTFEVRTQDASTGNSRTLATGRGSMPWRPGVFTLWADAQITWPEGAAADLLSGNTTITVKGDREAATDVYIQWPFHDSDPICWTGEFTVPLKLLPAPGTP